MWRRLGERTTWATLRFGTLLAVLGRELVAELVTLELEEFLGIVAAHSRSATMIVT